MVGAVEPNEFYIGDEEDQDEVNATHGGYDHAQDSESDYEGLPELNDETDSDDDRVCSNTLESYPGNDRDSSDEVCSAELVSDSSDSSDGDDCDDDSDTDSDKNHDAETRNNMNQNTEPPPCFWTNRSVPQYRVWKPR